MNNKKISLITYFILFILLFSGCNSNGNDNDVFTWVEDDFCFYNSEGKVKVFPTIDDSWVHLSDESGLRTFRGVEIGDKATEIIDNYDLTDFEWGIVDDSVMSMSTEQSKRYEDKLRTEGVTTAEIFTMLPEISAVGFDVSLTCDVYKPNGQLCTYSELDISDSNYGERYPDEERAKRFYAMDYLKYELLYSFKGEKIREITIRSSYHDRLPSAYDKDGNLKEGSQFAQYDWVKELK